ncbi:MAG TPA: hypothetical protein VK308_03625 [Pyrinomonadaceae bacterium]|nr:hypothetical protein [Pyrinomonadaceae bacterium]
MNKNSKAGAANTGSKPKNLIIAGGKSKASGFSNYAEKEQDLQANLMAIIKPNPTVKRLHRCNGCGECFTAEKFSIFFNVCKKCLRDVKGKGKLAQSNFIERALNNFRKNLRGALQNV